MALEEQRLQKVCTSLEANPSIVLLGRNELHKVPIFAFLVRAGDRFLHFNFVCALLNDLFGVQTRGGCQCAGPYATRLLGITDDYLYAFERAMVDKQLVLRAGFSRISFPYFMGDTDVDYLLEALHFVAGHGWKFLPFYRFNYKTGAWAHHTRFTKFRNRRWLSGFSTSKTATTTTMADAPSQLASTEQVVAHQAFNLTQARDLARDIMAGKKLPDAVGCGEIRDDHYETLRWFVYPSEAMAAIKSGKKPEITTVIRGPVQPHKYSARDPALAYSNVESLSGSLVSHIDWSQFSQESGHGPKPDQLEAPVTTTPLSNDDETRETDRVVDSKRPLRSTANHGVATTSSSVAFDHAAKSTDEISRLVQSARVHPTPPRAILKWVGSAISQWNMILEGDRLLVGVSGGKDSLVLHLQKRSRVTFEIACATVDPCSTAYDPSPLRSYIKSLGLEHFYLHENLTEWASTQLRGHSLLAYTARMKRGALYSCCRERGFNKLVLGHNLDDVAESFFLSTIHNGQLRTMRASYWNDAHDVCVVRPLVLVREHVITQFALEARLSVVNENMPQGFEPPKDRQRSKGMLSKEESLFPELFGSLRRALQPLLSREDLSRGSKSLSSTGTHTKSVSPTRSKKAVSGKRQSVRRALARIVQTFAAIKCISAEI